MKLGTATLHPNPSPLFIPKKSRESAVESSGMGRLEEAISCYGSALRLQIQALGESDPRALHTYRYLAEAHMEVDEAEDVCRKMFEVHGTRAHDEATNYQLLALVLEAKGDYESALECLLLASSATLDNGEAAAAATIDVSIGNTYLCLGRFDDAAFSYRKALAGLRSTRGDDHPSVASVLVRLADLHHRAGRVRESSLCCEDALRIYAAAGPTGGRDEEVASGLTQIAAVYESLNEAEEALGLLRGARDLLAPSRAHRGTVGGLEAQMGAMLYVAGRYSEAYAAFEGALSKLHEDGESAFFGVVLNQAGLACIQLYRIAEAASLFEKAREIMERECGTCHLDTLGVCSNLAAAYDAMGRVEEAIEILEYIVKVREEKLGTGNPDLDVDDEKKRLGQLLKEAGRSPPPNPTSLRSLLASHYTLGNKVRAKKKNKWPGFTFKN